MVDEPHATPGGRGALPNRVSTPKVVLAAVICLFLGAWFAQIILMSGPDLAAYPIAFLASTWITSRIARERTVAALIPSEVFLGTLAAVGFVGPSEHESLVALGLLILVGMVACWVLASWLARRATER